MVPRSNQKLSYRFFGPFKIVAKVGAVAYKLALPPDCKIHPVVHVSQLKKHIPADTQVSSDLSSVSTDPFVEVSPVAVLDHKRVAHAGAVVPRVKIQWSGMPSTLATWEDEKDLRRRFPSAPAWGHAGFQGRGNVRTSCGKARSSDAEGDWAVNHLSVKPKDETGWIWAYRPACDRSS